jgi:hypothetical protein
MAVMTRSMRRALQEQTQPKHLQPKQVQPKQVQPKQVQPKQVQPPKVEVKQYTDEEKEAALDFLTSTLRALDIWYHFIDNHDDFMRGKAKVDEYKRVLNQYNLSLEQRLRILNNEVFDTYAPHSKTFLRNILGVPHLIQ